MCFFTEMDVRMLQLHMRCKWCPSSFSSSMILKSVTPGSLWPALFSPICCKDTLTQGMLSGNLQVYTFFSVSRWAIVLQVLERALWQNFPHLIFGRSLSSLATAGIPTDEKLSCLQNRVQSNLIVVWGQVGWWPLQWWHKKSWYDWDYSKSALHIWIH